MSSTDEVCRIAKTVPYNNCIRVPSALIMIKRTKSSIGELQLSFCFKFADNFYKTEKRSNQKTNEVWVSEHFWKVLRRISCVNAVFKTSYLHLR